MNSFETKIMRVLGESTGAIMVIAILSGFLWSIFKFITINIFKSLGIDYFAEIAESYRWIGQMMIESRAILNADRACYYRTSNGKVFIEDSDVNNDIRVKAIVNVVKNKSLTILPSELNRKYFDWFREIQKFDNYFEQFAQELPIHSQLRNDLIKYNITAYLSVKVKFDKDLYGVIVYTWSDVRDIPKNIVVRHREYLDDLKNSVLIETIFIVSRSIKYNIYSFFRNRHS